MQAELDPRIVRVSFEINNQLATYEGLAITAKGTKYGNANQNTCQITITNLSVATRDYLLTESSPFHNRANPKRVILEVGRVSYGVQKLFEGDIVSSNTGTIKPPKDATANDNKQAVAQNDKAGQPPDIDITIRAMTQAYNAGKMVSRSHPPKTRMSKIAGGIASDLGVSLKFEADDSTVANYSHAGGALSQVDKLGQIGGVNAYVDDEQLIVKPTSAALRGIAHLVSKETGMIGVPEFTDRGIKVKMLINSNIRLGGLLQVVSKVVPAANGNYIIYKLGFEIASRDTPFYYIAEGSRI